MLQFEHLSNEIFLCIWDYLSSADVIYSFSNLNNRINSLLIQFHYLYKQLDLRYCSLSACRFLSRVVPTKTEWYINLTVLKLGSLIQCSQVNLFIDGVIKSIIEKQKKSHDNMIKPIFPQLIYLHVYLNRLLNKDLIETLLFTIAGGTTMRRFICKTCSNQIHHSKVLFDWLFRCSINLNHYELKSSQTDDGFELIYEHTIINNYIPHNSLVYFKINILNLNTLYTLMHYLPQLEHLDVNISSVIGRNDDMDENLVIKLAYPKKLRVFIIRHIQIAGSNCIYLEQLVNKFHNTLEKFSLFLTHYCDGELDICFDGHRLTTLCNKLTYLRVLHFVIQLRFLEPPNKQILYHFIKHFRTSFWLNGPIGRVRVCVNFNKIFYNVQMFSLPYTFFDNTLYRTTELIDTLFNIDEDETEIMSNDLSVIFKSLWCGMRCLIMCFVEKEKLPISLFYALQCPYTKNKTLALATTRGILPNDIDNHLQLTHFNSLQLLGEFDTMIDYDIQQIIGWFRLLPNIKSLFITTRELNYWITHDSNNQYINRFLQNLDKLYIECSSIINENINEKIMIRFLSFVINKQHFPRLECLSFIQCKYISLSWCNINKWINYIFNHINEHQLKYLQFDFIEKEQQITDMKTGDEIITISDPLCIIDIYRCVSENYISFWIERKYK